MAEETLQTATLVSLVHLGCARNLIDSELILGRMAEEGLMVASRVEDAEAVVLNTCSFIGPARAESEGAIEDLLARKRRGELRHVVVAGCLVQRYQKALAERFPEVDLFAEISDYRALAKSLRELTEGGTPPRYLASADRAPEREGGRLLATPGSYSYLRISHGCDHQCSFCAIPGIRGKHRSKRLVDLVSEAEELSALGVHELVLVAEDSTAWGRDTGEELATLLAALGDVDGVQRVRLMYAYPNRFPWEIAPVLRDHPHVVPYLDIPVQHIATDVLRGMRRAGSGDQVRKVLDRLRNEVPNITLRTTVLLGFPGETEAHAEELAQFVRDYQLGRLGAFTYSPEEGTSAYTTDAPAVPASEAEARRTLVLQARDEVLRSEQESKVGQRQEILVDERWPQAERVAGRGLCDAPETDLVTIVAGSDAVAGDTIEVLIEGVDEDFNLIGTQVEVAP